MGKSRQLKIVRDTEGSNFLNRICREVGTKARIPWKSFELIDQDILYYIEMGPGNTISFRRGGKDGTVIATADPCHERQGSSKIEMASPSTTVVLSIFLAECLCSHQRLHSRSTATSIIGKVTQISSKKNRTNCMPNISAVVMQQRSDARKRAVSFLIFVSNILGLCFIGDVGTHSMKSGDVALITPVVLTVFDSFRRS